MRIYIRILFVICSIIAGSSPVITFAQSITGKIVANDLQPIDGAAIILQTMDSAYIDASISDANGIFIFNKQPDRYRLIIQHLSFHTKLIESKGCDIGIVEMDSKISILNEIVIKADRPFVKVEEGRLNYNLSQLADGKVVNNAYEALTKLPGVQEMNGVLSLAGAGSLTVILNGKPTTMGAAQLETLLRNTPVGRVEKAEVMYSAPPQYHARGAVVNVVLKRSNDYSFQGELNVDYTNRYYNSGGLNGNFRFTTPKMAFDVMYGTRDAKNIEYMDIYSRHTLKDQIYEIRENNRISSKNWDHNLRMAVEYNFDDKSNINLAYTSNINPSQHNKSKTTGNFQTSNTDKYINTRMHNVSMQYHSAFGLDVGGDYTYYRSDNQQKLSVVYHDGRQSGLILSGGQKINRYSVYADQNHKLEKNWNLGYGASYKFALDSDFQTYNQVIGDIHVENSNSNLNEHTANLYLSLSKSYESGTSFSISATGEYYSIGSYRKWAIYPQVSFTYVQTPKHIFLISLSTDKTYPSYWDMQSSVSYVDGYTELWGTPGLRPMTTYNLNGSYILKNKYIFSLFFMHTADYFAQAGYQSPDRLALIYKNMNWNYIQASGVNVVLPFNIGSWLDSRLTLGLVHMRQRCDEFFDISFDRKKWMFTTSLDNTFKVYKKISLELNGYVQTPAIQGTFDIKSVFNLTAGLKWSFAKDKMTLSARCSDILGTGAPNLNIRFKGQYFDMNNAFYTRAFNVHFTYRFGGYKKKENKQVDTSRFGH